MLDVATSADEARGIAMSLLDQLNGALDPVLLDFTNGRAAQKRKYRGELFITGLSSGAEGTFLEFLQLEKHTGAAKGIVGVRLGGQGAQP